jgi:hypothetical protein
MTRRHFVFGALVLAGCGENKLARTVVDAYQLTVVGHPDVPISRSQVTNLPYASIAAKIGKGPRSLLVLWRRERDDLHWLSADNTVIVTRGGRVVKTSGLPESMRETRFMSPDPVAAGLQTHDTGNRIIREVDLTDPLRYGLLVESYFEALGPEEISITDITFDTLRFAERCTIRNLNWSFTNLYWVDPADGFVWKSRQTIGRGFAPIEIEVLKPAI